MIDFLFPPRCPGCGRPIPSSSVTGNPSSATGAARSCSRRSLCGRIASIPPAICPLCAASLPRTRYELNPDNPVALRLASLTPFHRAHSHFFYTPDSLLAALIHDFKYRFHPSTARYLGALMASDLAPHGYFADIDAILPIPIHWTRRLRRGYSQTRHLASGILSTLLTTSAVPTPAFPTSPASTPAVPIISDALRAIRPHRTQTALTPAGRLQNTRSIFRLDRRLLLDALPSPSDTPHLLLLDDVCTTGATVASAAEAVLDAIPGACLTILTLATPG
ncbi:MAG: ComF family protein [Bacteroides sp.]|nr:ComF family protein [Bacteroides sp.]